MGNLALSLISVFLILPGACCSPQEREQPHPPEKVAGWKDSYSGGVHSVGELFLRKGDSSDNGKIGVKVIDVVVPQPGSEGYASMPKVVLQFYKPSDKQVLCEATFTEGGTFMGAGPPYPHCKPEVGLAAISVNAINTKDKWVWFDLRK
jgi:hypothetical protein